MDRMSWDRHFLQSRAGKALFHQQHFGPGPTLDNLRRMARLSGEPPMDQEITLTETEQRVYAYLVKYWGRT